MVVSRLEKALAWRASSSLNFVVSAYESCASCALLRARLDAMRKSPRLWATQSWRRFPPKLSTTFLSWKCLRACWRMTGSSTTGGAWWSSGVVSPLPSPSCTIRSRGEEALGGLSLKDGAWPSVAECDGASTSPTLCLLKTRPEKEVRFSEGDKKA